MRKISLYLLLIAFVGCSKEGAVENIYNIPEEFKLDLTQVLSENGTTPAFKLTTLEMIGCSDQRLKTEYYRQINNAFIKIIGVEKIDQCLSSDYISSVISDDFKKGLYNVRVQIKNDVENQGTFSVQDDYFYLTMNESPNIQLGDTYIHRLPSESWWGALYFTDDYRHDQIEKLKGILEKHTLIIPELKIGNYGLFKINESENIIIEEYKNHTGYYGFCFKQNLTETSLVDKINSFLSQNPGAHIFLASDNKIFLDI